MSMNHYAVPDIPGIKVEETAWLKEKIAKLLDLNSYKFPGAQPISFGKAQMDEINNEDYYVAEKSDGIRCLALLTRNQEKKPEIYLMYFPLPQDPSFHKVHDNTIIDGELVLDKEDDGSTQLKFLLFDCLMVQGRSLISRDLIKRLGYLKVEVLGPYNRMLQKYPHFKKKYPFITEFKEQQPTYKLDAVFEQVIPNLRHGNDGLIFTSVKSPYLLGTSNKIIKWKPANENSVDFKVQLTFVPSTTIPGAIDPTKKPTIDLLAWERDDEYSKFTQLGITDEEWFDTFGKNPRHFNGRIIECNYDIELQQKYGLVSPWRFMRFRDDKPHANHITTIRNVIISIDDGVTKEELVDNIDNIRYQWNLRDEIQKENERREKERREKERREIGRRENERNENYSEENHRVENQRKRKQDHIE